MHFGLAIRVFFRIIWHSEFACRVESLVRRCPRNPRAWAGS